MVVINNRLRETRKQFHLTQQQLADATDYSCKTIYRVERGIQEPTYDFMFRMVAYFNLSLEDVFEIEN